MIEGQLDDTIGAVRGPERFRIRMVDGEGRPALVSVTLLALEQLPQVRLRRVGSTQFTTELILATEADGTLPLQIYSGDSIGTARVTLSATGLGRDTLEFEIRPGNAVGLRVVPADTTVYVGASFVTRTGAVDRLGHLRGEPSPVTVTAAASASGPTIRGEQIGRAMVVTSGALGTDTGYVSVVPPGTLAGFIPLDGGKLVVAGLDGSGMRVVKDVPTYSSTARIQSGLAWFPGQDEVAFVVDTVLQGVIRDRLYRLRLDGTGFRRIRVSTNVHPENEAYPAFAGDTLRLYFQGYSSLGADLRFLWRMAPDGTSAAGLGPVSDQNRFAGRPSPSPDGTRVAFVTNNDGTTLAQVAIWDFASQTMLPWQVSGQAPAWSPSGGEIAFVDEAEDRVGLVNSDGTGARLVTPPGLRFTIQQLTWSGDGAWISAVAEDGVYLVRASDGLLLRLGDWARYWQSPALKR